MHCTPIKYSLYIKNNTTVKSLTSRYKFQLYPDLVRLNNQSSTEWHGPSMALRFRVLLSSSGIGTALVGLLISRKRRQIEQLHMVVVVLVLVSDMSIPPLPRHHSTCFLAAQSFAAIYVHPPTIYYFILNYFIQLPPTKQGCRSHRKLDVRHV